MSVINTNITALVSQKNLSSSQNALSTAMERLSSGLRINSAKDDAAGLAISNRISSQVTGLMQAQRNANDGISISQTAEGALNQVNDNLQRIRELTVQSANETNSTSDLESIQNEITLRLDEIDRISDTTSFNGVKVLAEERGVAIQVGANDGETITMNLREMSSSQLGLSGFDVSSQFRTEDLSATPSTEITRTLNVSDANFSDEGTSATYEIYVQNGSGATGTAGATIIAYNTATDLGYAATYNQTTGVISIDSSTAAITAGDTGAGAGSYSAVASGQGVNVGDGVSVSVDDLTSFADSNADAEPKLFQTSDGDFFVSTDGASNFYTASVNFTTGTVTYDTDTAAVASTNAAFTGANAIGTASAALSQVSDNDVVTLDASGVSNLTNAQVFAYEDGSGYVVSGNDSDGNTAYYEASVAADGTVTAGAQLTEDPLATLDDALTSVDVLRSELGAAQNRFESAISNLATTQTNLSAARSRILDADYAVEVSNLTRAQILQQAGTSVLAQANQVPQGVLSLLR